MIDRARQLDPLEPEYDVLKALDLYLGRGQVREPDALLADVVARHPLYLPALQRIAEVRFAGGHYADAVMYAERALKLDPLNEMTRLVLIDNYLNAGDPGAALQVADVAPHQLPIQRLLLYLHQGDWRRAAEVSYAAWEDGTMMPIAVPAGVSALRMDARTSGDFRRARELLEHLCRVTWSAGGVPTIPMQIGGAYECVALGDILIASGARARGERLLRASLADMNYVAHDLKRGDHWYVHDQAVAAALLGDQKAALATLRRAVDIRRVTSESLEGDPAFNAIRGTAEFQEMIRALKAAQARERQALDRLRASGRVPDRSAPANSDRITPRAPPAKP